MPSIRRSCRRSSTRDARHGRECESNRRAVVDGALDGAQAELEVVVDDVAAGRFERTDEAERRLLAEGAAHDHAHVVVDARRPLARPLDEALDEGGVLLGIEHAAGARHQVRFGGAHAVRLIASELVERGQRAPAPVLARDGSLEPHVVERQRAAGREVAGDAPKLVCVEAAPPPEAEREVLRQVDVGGVPVGEQHLPHTAEVADDVADRRKEHGVERVEAAGQRQLERRARDMADVRLEVRVAADAIELVAAAEDPPWAPPSAAHRCARDGAVRAW